MKNEYYDSALSYKTMRKALNRCCRNVRWKDSVVGYELHAPQNTVSLIEDIRNGKYKISPYQKFIIHEPKEREIVATRIRDRQVQMALCLGGLYEDITEHFIYDNCACQKGKGTDFAFKRIKVHLSRYYRKYGRDGWILKLDVKHFFPSTRHDVAKNAVNKYVSDERVRQMVFDVIDSFDGEVGIGLGSQISQLVELAVLNDLDHYIKERLRIKHYVRYMDDLIIIHEDKEYLKFCREKIREELAKLHLELNRKTTIYPLSQGVKFLQWRFMLTDTGKIIMKMNGKKPGKERRRLKKLAEKEKVGEVVKGTTLNSMTAWIANAQRGDSYYRICRMKQFYKTLLEQEDANDITGTNIESRT